MIKEGRIGMYEAVCLTSITIISKLFFANISELIAESWTAAWQSTIISCLISIFFFYIACQLMRRFPGQNIIEIFSQVFGKFAGAFIGVAYVVYTIFYAGSNLRELVEMIKSYNLPYTPIELLIGSVLVTAAVICYYGFECLARVSAIFFIPIILGMVVVLLLAIPSYDIMLFRPLWGYGIGNTLYHSVFRSSTYTEVLLLAVFASSLQGTDHFKKAGFISLVISGVSFTVSIFLYIISYGYSLAQEKTSGLFELARDIYFNRFFQRVESIFLFAWVISSVIGVTIAIYIALSCYCKAFKLKNHRPLIFPVIFLTFAMSMLPRNLLVLDEVYVTIIRHYSALWAYPLPALALILSLILKRKGRKAGEKNA